MRAARLHRPAPIAAYPLVVGDAPEPVLHGDEVLIAASVCGVCRTDLQLCEGDLVARRLPIIPGHQVVGRIVATGSRDSPLSIGTRVGVAWIAGTCGACRFCRTGRENLCESAAFTGWDRDGGFAQLVTARADFVYPLPDGFDDIAVAPLLCGGAIGYRCLRVAGARRGMRLGLYGFGASATIVLQVARHIGCEVYVVTRNRQEQQRSLELGARWTGSYDERPPAVLDAAITFAPVGSVVVTALSAIDRGGVVVVNAIHLDEIPAFDYDALWWERSIRSVANVTRDDVRDLLALAPVIPLVTHTDLYPIAEANRALADVRAGTVQGAAVLTIDG
jgi:propanol-preferring alcohol dehydrogenase